MIINNTSKINTYLIMISIQNILSNNTYDIKQLTFSDTLVSENKANLDLASTRMNNIYQYRNILIDAIDEYDTNYWLIDHDTRLNLFDNEISEEDLRDIISSIVYQLYDTQYEVKDLDVEIIMNIEKIRSVIRCMC